MKAWKKFAAIVLALGLTAGFAACGGDNNDNSSSQNAGGTSSESSSQQTGGSGGEVVGGPSGEVTEEEFIAAIEASYAAMNFTLVRTDPYGTTTSKSADGKVYSVAQGPTSTSYCYMGEVDGVFYMWTSEYQDYWDYEEWNWTEEYHPASGESALNSILRWCEFSYAQFDADTGMYQFTNLGAPTVYAKVTNGKISQCRLETAETEWIQMDITYGDATVGELPPLD